MATTMASEVVKTPFQHWTFGKEIIGSRKRSSSGASSMEFFDAEDKVRVAPSMEKLSRALKEGSSQNLFDERYLSSEEALSPTEPDMDLSDGGYDLEDILDASEETSSSRSKRSSSNSIIDLAVAVTIVLVGKAKMIDVMGSSSPKVTYVARKPSPLPEKKPQPALHITPFTTPQLDDLSTPPSVYSPISPVSGYSYNPSFDELSRPLSASLSKFQFGPIANRKSVYRVDTAPAALHLRRSPLGSHAPHFASQPDSPVTPDLPPRSRLRSIGHKFSMLSRKNSTITAASATPDEPLAENTQHHNHHQHHHRRPSSVSPISPTTFALSIPRPQTRRLKMRPRGAAEREPITQLPPEELAPLADSTATPFPPRYDSLDQKARPQRRLSLLGWGSRGV